MGLAAQTFAGKAEPSIDGTWRFPPEVFGKSSLVRMSFSNGRAVLSVMDYGATRTFADYYFTGTYTVRKGLLTVKFTQFRIDERRLSQADRDRFQSDPDRLAKFRTDMLRRSQLPPAKIRTVDAKRLILVRPDGKKGVATLLREG